MITIKINLTDLPKDRMWTDKLGKKNIELCITELREPDKYENTHTVYVSQSKDQREAKAPKHYCGKGKEINFNKTQKQTSTPVDNINSQGDDLPF